MLPVRVASPLLLLLCSPSLAQERLLLPYDNKLREVLVDAAPGVRHALVVALHGGLAGPRFVRWQAGVTLQRRGWVVAWPSADQEWNDGRRDGNGAPYNHTDDVGFLRSLVARLAQDGLVDPMRVFVAGVSLGGTMTLRLVCEAPELVRGAAVSSPRRPTNIGSAPQAGDRSSMRHRQFQEL